MRPHNNAFCRVAAETFECPGPVFEFGSFQVEGQDEFSDLRRFFPGRSYLGCDFRKGPGVDRVEDVTAIRLADATVGTVLCIETFEHVYEVQKAFAEVFRVLRPGGVFLLTSPFHFRIHAYPDDYWRFTPSLLRRIMAPYGGLIVGSQGPELTPHTVMSLGIKAPAPVDFSQRAARFIAEYRRLQEAAEAGLPLGQKLRRSVATLYRSRGERRLIAEYYQARFSVDEGGPALAVAV